MGGSDSYVDRMRRFYVEAGRDQASDGSEEGDVKAGRDAVEARQAAVLDRIENSKARRRRRKGKGGSYPQKTGLKGVVVAGADESGAGGLADKLAVLVTTESEKDAISAGLTLKFALIQVDMDKGLYAKALERLKVLEESLGSGKVADITALKARCLYKLGRTEEAVRVARGVLRNPDVRESFGSVLPQLAFEAEEYAVVEELISGRLGSVLSEMVELDLTDDRVKAVILEKAERFKLNPGAGAELWEGDLDSPFTETTEDGNERLNLSNRMVIDALIWTISHRLLLNVAAMKLNKEESMVVEPNELEYVPNYILKIGVEAMLEPRFMDYVVPFLLDCVQREKGNKEKALGTFWYKDRLDVEGLFLDFMNRILGLSNFKRAFEFLDKSMEAGLINPRLYKEQAARILALVDRHDGQDIEAVSSEHSLLADFEILEDRCIDKSSISRYYFGFKVDEILNRIIGREVPVADDMPALEVPVGYGTDFMPDLVFLERVSVDLMRNQRKVEANILHNAVQDWERSMFLAAEKFGTGIMALSFPKTEIRDRVLKALLDGIDLADLQANYSEEFWRYVLAMAYDEGAEIPKRLIDAQLEALIDADKFEACVLGLSPEAPGVFVDKVLLKAYDEYVEVPAALMDRQYEVLFANERIADIVDDFGDLLDKGKEAVLALFTKLWPQILATKAYASIYNLLDVLLEAELYTEVFELLEVLKDAGFVDEVRYISKKLEVFINLKKEDLILESLRSLFALEIESKKAIFLEIFEELLEAELYTEVFELLEMLKGACLVDEVEYISLRVRVASKMGFDEEVESLISDLRRIAPEVADSFS